jgi:hypothetical protein
LGQRIHVGYRSLLHDMRHASPHLKRANRIVRINDQDGHLRSLTHIAKVLSAGEGVDA